MSFKNLSQMDSDILHVTFRKPGFIEKTAQWARYFCYGCLLITAIAIVINLFKPISESVPDLFMQLLFLLIFWGTIELLTIPLEHIHDFYVVDFQKNWIAMSQQRLFFRRIAVIASFNQVKAIGASIRPEGLKDLLFSSKEKTYAIFIQTLKGELHQISDYELSLDEANAFCHRLYSTHFSGAAYVGASPGMQISIDQNTGQVRAQPSEHASKKVLKNLSAPFMQATIAFCITLLVLNISFNIIARASMFIFATDLSIRKQPIFQLLIGKVPIDETAETNESAGQESIAKTISIPFPATPDASSPVKIDLVGQQIVKATDSATSPTENVTTDEAVSSTSAGISEPVKTAAVTTPAKKQAPENLPSPQKSEKPFKPSVESSSQQTTRTLQFDKDEDLAPEKHTDENQFVRATLSESSSPNIPKSTGNTPIPSRIPDIDFRKAIVAENVIEPVKNSINFSYVPSYKYSDKTVVASRTVKLANSVKPVRRKIEDLILAAQTSGKSIAQAGISAKPEKAEKKMEIMPGYGIYPNITIGSNFSDHSPRFGNPLGKYKSMDGWQIIYAGLSVTINSENPAKITRITITSPKFGGETGIATPQGLKVGSSVSQIQKKYGPYTIFESLPGMHFTNLGISFFHSPSAPDKVGAIQIYSPIRN
jgi:hypothetical protein